MSEKIIVLILLVSVISGCSVSLNTTALKQAQDNITQNAADKTSEGLKSVVASSVDQVKEQTLNILNSREVLISESSIDPETLTYKEGDTVRLKLKCDDKKNHGFYLPDFEITQAINVDDESIVSFKADKKGLFTYSCNINCTDSVKGTLTIE